MEHKLDDVSVVSLGPFDAGLRAMILYLKHRRDGAVGFYLGQQLARHFPAQCPIDAVTWIPSQPLNRLKRGGEALTALTPDTLRQLIHAQPVGSFTHPNIEQAWHARWNRALELASMCRELSIQTQIGQPEDIEIRVMWGELGSLVLLEYLDHEPAIAQDPAAIRSSLMACSREASQMIIREWKLGELTEKIAASHPDHPPAARYGRRSGPGNFCQNASQVDGATRCPERLALAHQPGTHR